MDYEIYDSIAEIMILNELMLPKRKSGQDVILFRKLKKQEKIENKFILKFFSILEKYQPANERAVDKFIDRYHKYISEDFVRVDISIQEIFNFIRFLGMEEMFDKVGRVTGIRSAKRINELKNELKVNFLDKIKKIMRGTTSDKTHSGVTHPLQVNERFSAMRIRNILARWHMRQVKRQLSSLS